jgi:hypothetical protein
MKADWIYEKIMPVIEHCKTPEEAEAAVRKWGMTQEPRDAAIGLFAVQFMNAHFEKPELKP